MSRDLRRALEERLAASSPDYEEVKRNIRSASAIVLVVAAIYIGWGAILFLVDYTAEIIPGQGSHAVAAIDLAARLTIGIAMLACFAWCPRFPRAALVSALVMWLSVQVLLAAASPLTIVQGVFFKLIVMFLLIRGVVAALRAESVMRRLEGVAA